MTYDTNSGIHSFHQPERQSITTDIRTIIKKV